MLRQVFVRDSDSGKWSRRDASLLPTAAEDQSVGFEDIDGFSESEIYAVGLNGEIWTFDGNDWKKLKSPTKANLASLRCAPDGQVYIVGDNGIVIQGRGESWHAIEQSLTKESFTCVEYAFGDVYVAGNGKGLYKYADSSFTEVETNLGGEVSTYHLHFNDDLLLSVGESDILTFDGAAWTRVRNP